MKLSTALASAIALLGAALSSGASAQTSDSTLSFSQGGNVSTTAAALALPVGVTLKQILRLNQNKDHNHLTHGELPANWGQLGWTIDGPLGFVSNTQFAGAHILYSCYIQNNLSGGIMKFMTSLEPECEGFGKVSWAYFIGYVSDTQITGTRPLYRCWYQAQYQHFDTWDANCENVQGATLDGILGYVFY